MNNQIMNKHKEPFHPIWWKQLLTNNWTIRMAWHNERGMEHEPKEIFVVPAKTDDLAFFMNYYSYIDSDEEEKYFLSFSLRSTLRH
jgi:hypothetical protein